MEVRNNEYQTELKKYTTSILLIAKLTKHWFYCEQNSGETT